MHRFYFSMILLLTILFNITGISLPIQIAPVSSSINTSSVRTMSASIYFDDSNPDLLVLGNSYWEVAFRKTNGSIVYLTDRTIGGQISTGSRNECLWGAVDQADLFYMGGCSYSKGSNNPFTYHWVEATHTLNLSFNTDINSANQFTTTVQVIASESDYFDMQMTAQEHYTDNRLFDWVIFPSDLYFNKADVKGVLLPLLPGVVLKPGFFTDNRNYSWNYPGYPGGFADYIAFSTNLGEMAIYSIYNAINLEPVSTTLIGDEANHLTTYYFTHNFGVMLKPNQIWTSPIVRFRFSKTWPETIQDYRVDNGLDKFPSIIDKLGPLYYKVSHMPEYRLVSSEVNAKFSQYETLFFSQLRTPGILHLVGYQPGGHDHHSPDYLPPNQNLCNDPNNCTQEFAAMFNQAKADGWLVMPYTNPTWWNPDGATLQNLPPPLTAKDISVQDRSGNPIYEGYNGNYGYVVSPYVPFVEQRLNQFLTDMTTLVPSDLIFEDQVGARPWLFDFNSFSPSLTSYIQGWIDHTKTYKDKLLSCELGFDRLSETEVGFYGSILLPQKLGQTATNWGDNNWSPYPLAQMMSRDKIVFYQHDLALETFSDNKANITWDLAMGYNMGDDLRLTEGVVHDNPWLKLNGELQDHLLADYATELVTDYVYLTPTVTQTNFQNFIVIANWDSQNPYILDGNTISPDGALIKNRNGSEIGGIFTAFNGQPLTSGDHYLIIKNTLNQIIVRQPMGNDTSLTLNLPSGWQSQDPIQVKALNKTGNLIATLPFTISNNEISVTFQASVNAQEVEEVSIFDPNITIYITYLPNIVH